MKRLALWLTLPLFLTGCAQMFDANFFAAVDTPPALSASELGQASVSDIKSMLADNSFYGQLKDDPDALAAVQSALEDAYTAAGATDAEVVDAAQTYILVTAYGSGAGAVVQDAINQASDLISGGTPEDAVTALFGGKSATEISSIVTNFLAISDALDAMQDAATSGTAVDSDAFFGSTTSQGDLAQTSLVAAAVDALYADYVADGKTKADLVADLAAGTLTNSSTANLTKLSGALDGSSTNPASNPYAYLSAITGILPF